VFGAILAAAATLGISKAFYDDHRVQVQNKILREEADRMERATDEMFAELKRLDTARQAEIKRLDTPRMWRYQTTPTPNPRH